MKINSRCPLETVGSGAPGGERLGNMKGVSRSVTNIFCYCYCSHQLTFPEVMSLRSQLSVTEENTWEGKAAECLDRAGLRGPVRVGLHPCSNPDGPRDLQVLHFLNFCHLLCKVGMVLLQDY